MKNTKMIYSFLVILCLNIGAIFVKPIVTDARPLVTVSCYKQWGGDGGGDGEGLFFAYSCPDAIATSPSGDLQLCAPNVITEQPLGAAYWCLR